MRPLPRVDRHATARGPGLARWLVRLVGASLLLLIAPALQAQSTAAQFNFGAAKWPPHPMLLLAKYRGYRLPVVAVEKNQPVVLLDGRRKTLSDSTPLVTQLAEDYHPAQVTFTGNIDIGKRSWETPPSRGLYVPDSTELREYIGTLSLESATDVPDAYVLLTLFDSGAADDPAGSDFCKSELIEVGALRAHERREVPLRMLVHMPLRYSNGDPSKKPGIELDQTIVFWQLFSQGVEIHTHDLSDIELRLGRSVFTKEGLKTTLEITGIGQFIYLRERVEHADAVEAWLKQNRKSNQPAQPYGLTPLQAGTAENLPKEASAILSLSAEGKVTQVVLEQAFPEEAARNITRFLKLWLFLPAIKNGSAVATRIRVPLAF